METKTSAHIVSRLEAPMWFSATLCMKEDISFMKQLLTAPIYKQNVPNVYERLTTFLSKINALSKKVKMFIDEVAVFKESLENYPEEDNPSFDEYYYGRQKHFMDDYIKLDTEFLELKSKLYTYLSGILLK